MTYPEVIHFLYEQLPMFSRVGAAAFKKDLRNIRTLCNALGNPQQKFKSIHVGGTNGKGSVCHILAAILQESGYKTGLHTSPHLVDFRERIRINGQVAPKEFVVDFVESHQEIIEKVQPSFFEISVAMAFQWFADNKIDIAVIEVGLGGRLDSTNILNPVLAVITNISLEHTQILGDTRTEIAGEKAGIIKKNTPIVIGETHPETEQVFVRKAKEMNGPIYFADQTYTAQQVNAGMDGQKIAINDNAAVFLDLGGAYQLQNMQTVMGAIAVLKQQGWLLPDEQMKKAFTQVKSLTGLRGRWDILSKKPLIIADTSHNVTGISTVLKQAQSLKYEKLYMVTGFVKDKNVKEILRLFPKDAFYFFCQADNPRMLPVSELQQMAKDAGRQGMAFSTVRDAVEKAKENASPHDLILITGSTFIVAEAVVLFH